LPVPKLIESTLAAHRAQQLTRILDSAYALLSSGGYAALTFAALAADAGLARPSIYSYFSSRDEVAVAVCERELPKWLEQVQLAMEAAITPEEKVAAYIRRQLELADSGQHRLADVLRAAPLGQDARMRLRAIHERFGPRLADVLTDLDGPQRAPAAALVQGLVNAGLQAVTQGEPSGTVIERTTAFALGGLDRLGARPAPSSPGTPAG
jgi:AcrR family transcriptional regulator